MLRVFLLAMCYSAAVLAIHGEPHANRTVALAGADISGFAVNGDRLFVWGEGVYEVDLRTGKRQLIAEGRFAEGGCFLDGGLVLNTLSPRELIWLRLTDRRRFVIDTGVDTRDAIAADLLGHHGVLLIHKRQQVRFYDLPTPVKDQWTETELYTIYTPSTEGGLIIADVDGDGLPDLLCGNYWMKSPTTFELPWREFAIDTWNEAVGSAMLRLAWSGGVRVAAQRDMQPGRVAWFSRAADPKQLWPAYPLSANGGFRQGVSGLLFIKKDLIVSENGPHGRVMIFHRIHEGFQAGRELIRTNQAIGMASLATGEVIVVEKFRAVLLRL